MGLFQVLYWERGQQVWQRQLQAYGIPASDPRTKDGLSLPNIHLPNPRDKFLLARLDSVSITMVIGMAVTSSLHTYPCGQSYKPLQEHKDWERGKQEK